jgi:hypothetical protein
MMTIRNIAIIIIVECGLTWSHTPSLKNHKLIHHYFTPADLSLNSHSRRAFSTQPHRV